MQEVSANISALAHFRSKYGGTAWQVITTVHELSKDEGVGVSVPRRLLRRTVPKDAWPSFQGAREPKRSMFGVEGEDGVEGRERDPPDVRRARRRGRGRPRDTVRESAANASGKLGVERRRAGRRRCEYRRRGRKTPTDVADVAYSRHCEKTGCLSDEQGCVTGRRADALFKLADKFYYGRYNGGDGGRDASRLGMHPFLSELLRNFKDDVGSKERHLRLYAGHDTVVAPLLSALGIFDGKWPPLASRIVFELREGGALRILFNGRDVSEEGVPRRLRGRLEGGPPGARGCDVAAFEARVAALLGGAASFDEACGN